MTTSSSSQILVTDYLKSYKATHCNDGGSAFDLNKPLVAQGFDSLDTIELVMAMEDDFKIEISDEIAKTWETPANIVLDVAQLLKGVPAQ